MVEKFARCQICDVEFTELELRSLAEKCCPNCKTKMPPVALKGDVAVQVNYTQLMDVFLMAEVLIQIAAKIPEFQELITPDHVKVFYKVSKVISDQHPDFGKLTIKEQIQPIMDLFSEANPKPTPELGDLLLARPSSGWAN